MRVFDTFQIHFESKQEYLCTLFSLHEIQSAAKLKVLVSPKLAMIVLSTVQSSVQILIHNGIFSVTTQQCLVQQILLAKWANIFGDNC